MIGTMFRHHVMLDTDDDLRADIDNPAYTPEEHQALIDALAARQAAHEAARHLEQGTRWTEIHRHHYIQTDDAPTGALNA